MQYLLEDKNDFMKYYNMYTRWYDKNRNTVTKNIDGKIKRLITDFTQNHQMQVYCNFVYYVNMSEAVFQHLRPYLKKHKPDVFKKINWDREAESIIDDLFSKK